MQYEQNLPQTSEERTMQRQAELISEQNEQFRLLHKRLNDMQIELGKLRPKADMYDRIVKMVMENPSLQSIWDDLIVTMKMLEVKV